MMNKPPLPSVYTLQAIATWDEEHKVSLPTVQRGFVWKPHQIENLWDSLLRGYPVGAFVLSPAGNGTLHMLDGQQRATAICLGFGKETFRDMQEYYKVFIDLEPPGRDDNRKFIFRVITKSHPWGYQKQDNNKTLTTDNIRKAMNWYPNVVDPLNVPLNTFFPFDADLPVPFHYFIDAIQAGLNEQQLFDKIKYSFLNWKYVYKKWSSDNKELLGNKSESEISVALKAKFARIYNAVAQMLDDGNGQKIPALYRNLEIVVSQEEQENDSELENESDEIENLFVRLNSGGTQLSGEELNYSILKAHISLEVQNEIEAACRTLFRPARFITIAHRLFQQENKEAQQADALSMRIKPKQFQRTISKQKKAFEDYILDVIRNQEYEGKNLLDYTQSVLEYQKAKQRYGLPFLIYSKISDTAPELMFLLLYRIKIKQDRFQNHSSQEKSLHRTMLGMVTLFLWFGKGENLKDHSKLLNNIWPAATNLNITRFWSGEIINRAYLNEVLLQFPYFYTNNKEIGLEKISKYNLSEKTNLLNNFIKDTDEQYPEFVKMAINNKDLILYAQREFLEKYFKHQQYRLEDTSVPFDWDHISPNRLVKSKKNLPKIIREWYQTNGNLRAWPYALNRMDSDRPPAYKLNPLENIDEEGIYDNLEAQWSLFVHNNSHLIKSLNELPKRLPEWSACEDAWNRCFISNLKEGWKPVVRLIIERNLNLIKTWYDELEIESFKMSHSFKFEEIINNGRWSKLPFHNADYDDYFEHEEEVCWMSSPVTLHGHKINFYCTYSDAANGHLELEGFAFGLFEVQGNNYLKKFKSKTDYNMDLSGFKWVNIYFTLVSDSKESWLELLNIIIEWLRNLPVPISDRNELINGFKEMLKSDYKKLLP